MTSITITIPDDVNKVLSRRAKKNLMSVKELVEDIIRRSAVRTKKNQKPEDNIDDRLVKVFSRSKRGRKRKK